MNTQVILRALAHVFKALADKIKAPNDAGSRTTYSQMFCSAAKHIKVISTSEDLISKFAAMLKSWSSNRPRIGRRCVAYCT